jgi:Type II secretion system (T2SS), protein E, N-terminal domain
MSKRLGELLIESGAVTAAAVDEALAAQAGGHPERLGEILVARGKLDPVTLARALSHQCGLPFTEIEPVPAEVSDLVPLDLQVQNKLTPFGLERTGGQQILHVAIADPATVAIIEDLSMQLGMAMKLFIASGDQIEAAHAAYQGQDPIVWPSPEPDQPTAPVAPIPAAPKKIPPVAAAVAKLNIPAAPARPLPRKAPERPRTSPPPPPLAAAPTEKRAAPPPSAPTVPATEPLAGLALPDWLSDGGDHGDQGIKPPDRALQLKLETLFAHGGIPSTESALATVVALLIRRGLLREHEVLDALGRK